MPWSVWILYSDWLGYGSSPPRRAFKSFNAHLAVDYPLLIYTTGPLNAWIWLADKRSEVWRSYYFSITLNYFQGNAWQTYSLDRITVSYHLVQIAKFTVFTVSFYCHITSLAQKRFSMWLSFVAVSAILLLLFCLFSLPFHFLLWKNTLGQCCHLVEQLITAK